MQGEGWDRRRPPKGRSPGRPQKPSLLERAPTPHVEKTRDSLGFQMTCREEAKVTAHLSVTPRPERRGAGTIEAPSLISEFGALGWAALCREQAGVPGPCSRALALLAASPQQPLAAVRVTLVSTRGPSAEALHQVGPHVGQVASPCSASRLVRSGALGPPEGPRETRWAVGDR